MADGVRIRCLQNFPTVAVDNQRRERRRVLFRVTAAMVDVRDMAHVMHIDAAVVPRVSRVAGDEEARCKGGKTEDAIAKPVPGSQTHPSHYVPRP